MKTKLLLLTTLMVLFLGSCVTPKDTNLLQDIPKNYPIDVNLNNDYKVIPGDQLVLKIFTLDESMQELFSAYIETKSTGIVSANTSQRTDNVLNVYSDGTVKIPYLGNILVEGYTIPEIKKILEDKFTSFSPNLTVDVNLQNRYFSVLGKAGQGRVSMPLHKINIFQALALSGPFDKFGDRTRVKIIRQTPNGTEVKTFDIRSKDIVDSEYYYIQPNDVIYVSEMSRTFFGRVTSFTGVLGLFGILGTIVGAVTLISRLTK
ncbi:polysaccharide biosynthesis/export family protein [Dysgonomonas macrotermitis]|uniref:Polysaccharide export outer membrane protein n=1 Tax=Dysgonomonas macrotermitis TaxID=1346286 RepID=A0A1M5DFA1_9BACT|nr:polysaccharide biosynthesis/export family protein [Dysgonomonas macrotermitis]SHF65657.1 polysaccharide export outer membrane protein [Dysgonomonas macrotermitis]